MKSRQVHQLEEAPPQEVKRIVRVLLDSEELFSTTHKQLVLPERGGIAFNRLLHQAMDGVNVIALDLTIGNIRIADIRRVDKKMEERVEHLISAAGKSPPTPEGIRVPIRLDAVIG